jgi:hypothetical protein
VIFLCYKDTLTAALSDLKGWNKLKVGPVEWERANSQTQAEQKPPDVASLVTRDQIPKWVRRYIDQVESDAENQLKLLKLNKDELLTRMTALARVSANFEQYYNKIFGSQLLLLRILNETGSVVDRAMAAKVYEGAVQRHPEFYRTYSEDQWLQFLVSARLVEETRGGAIPVPTDTVHLTDEGHAFVTYLTDQKYNFIKPF